MTNETSEFVAGKPGRYDHISFADYLAAPILSRSVIKKGRASMKAMKAAFDREFVTKPTDLMNLGSALHCCVLEPERIPERVMLWDGPARRGKEWESFKSDNEGRIILTSGYHAKLIGMVDGLRSHPEVKKLMNRVEAVEVTVVGDYIGSKCKLRTDAYLAAPGPVFDLKSLNDLSDRGIANAIYTFFYHGQADIYRTLLGRERFIIAFVESAPPYDVVVKELDADWLKLGEKEVVPLIQRWQYCCKQNSWPGRCDTLEFCSPPEWLMTQGAGEITIDGEDAF